MYSKFPFSMENIPRQRSFGCLSLKFGCILTALIVILYTLLALSQCSAELMTRSPQLSSDDVEGLATFAFIVFLCIVHGVSFVLSAFMLLGALRDKAHLIKPWVVWKSLQMLASILMFVLWSTINVVNQFDETTLIVYVAEFFSIVIRFYMLMIVASFCKQLEEANEETERLKSLINNDTWYGEAKTEI